MPAVGPRLYDHSDAAGEPAKRRRRQPGEQRPGSHDESKWREAQSKWSPLILVSARASSRVVSEILVGGRIA